MGVQVCAYVRDNVPHFKKAFLIQQPPDTGQKKKGTNRNTTAAWQRTRLYLRIEKTKHMVLSTDRQPEQNNETKTRN